jgi:hypothetical protein
MKFSSIFIALAVLPITPALAQSMPLSTFMAKADALEAKGPLALMSSDLPIIKKEVKTSMVNYRTMIDGQKAARKPLHSCPPAKGKLDSDEMMAAFRAVPVAQRKSINVQTALFAMMKKRYPCPA